MPVLYKFVEHEFYFSAWHTVQTTSPYLESVVRCGYYSTADVPTNFVDVTLSSNCCTTRRIFSSCVSDVNDREDQCDNHFASAACPGKNAG